MDKEYDICYPDYSNCIVNVMSTIMEYFHVAHKHGVNTALLNKLNQGGYKKVVLMILDGMGSSNISDNLSSGSFVLKHKIADISSVFPPTTVTALTSINTESMPNEHCWLGWNRYLSKFDKIESGFHSTLTSQVFPIEDVYKLFKKNKVITSNISPFSNNAFHRSDTLKGIINRIAFFTKFGREKFIYVYYNEPDDIMHELGVKNKDVKTVFEDIDAEIARLNKKLGKSTAVIITADHGQIDRDTYDNLSNYPELTDCLEAPLSGEPTAVSIRIKAEKRELFENVLFDKYFPGYKLFKAEEIVKSQLLGTADNNENFFDAIGDYYAVSIGRHVAYTGECSFKGVHAGLHYGEMTVPLIFLGGND